jgi:two-component system chemotaxis sensor kinase CheA
MDVVRANIERVGGAVELDSTPGQGTRLTIRVPLTLSIIPALTVGLAGQRFAIPRSAIEEIVHLGEDAIELSHIGSAMLAKVRDRRLPCLSLGKILHGSEPRGGHPARLVVLRLAAGELFALAVDELHDHEELVVKPIAPALMATGLYAGTTLTDDGSPILLLDIGGIARIGGLNLDSPERAARSAEPAAAAVPRGEDVLLFIGLDGGRRAIRMSVVGRIDEVEPAALRFGAVGPRAVIEDRLFPLAGVTSPPDAGIDKIRLFRLTDGVHEIAYALREVIDIHTLEGDMVPPPVAGEIEGLALIDGEPAEVVDPHWLFAQSSEGQFAGPTGRQPICRLTSDDPWLQSFLRPLAEAAGYRIIGAGDAEEADVAIAMDDAPLTDARAAELIRLRAAPEAGPESIGSVYRYDREGLTAAFCAARRRIAV